MAKSKIEHVVQAVVSPDQKLANHLRVAEENLIEAVKLFDHKKHPQRTLEYIKRLVRAQESVTSLFREELVRMRGPIKMTVKVKKK